MLIYFLIISALDTVFKNKHYIKGVEVQIETLPDVRFTKDYNCLDL